jgi:hypothetical protein
MKTLLLSIAGLAAAISAASAQVTTFARTVPNYDPVFPNPNQVDVMYPSAAWYASFTASLPVAWAANRGGVVNFDQPQTAPWPSPLVGTNFIRASYGISYTQSFGVSVPTLGDIGFHPPVIPISGKGDMMTKTGGVMGLGFTTTTGPVRQAGLTILQHPQLTQKVTVTFVQAVPGMPITYSFFIPAGPSNRDTFCGATSTVAGGIIGVRIHDNDALTGAPFRLVIDDLAFITKPSIVPVPIPVPVPFDPVATVKPVGDTSGLVRVGVAADAQ